MVDKIQMLKHALTERGFAFSQFATAQQAADYLDSKLDGVSIGIGGSQTIQQMGLYPRLSAHNQVHWHWEGGKLSEAATAQVYLTSVNAIAQTGELVNIDGNCNRISASVFGHQAVYFLVGRNKLTPDYDSALYRARNVAAPKRAQSMGRNTPCAAHADRCYDCKSPERICRGLTVLWAKPSGIHYAEVIFIDEALGM